MNQPGTEQSGGAGAQQTNIDDAIKAAELRKLDAEAQARALENSWKGQLPKHLGALCLLLSTLAALLTASYGFMKYFDDKEKERSLREKEIVASGEDSYKASFERLLNFSRNNGISTSQARVALLDVGRQIEKLPLKDEVREARRGEVTAALASIFKEESFDFSNPRTLEFELGIVDGDSWDAYKRLLERDKKINMEIMYKYSTALFSLHEKAPDFVEAAELTPTRVVHSKHRPTPLTLGTQFEELSRGYARHFELLKSGPARTDGDLHEGFCMFYRVTKNESFARDLLDYAPAEVDACKF
jgi:hypothetical protein